MQDFLFQLFVPQEFEAFEVCRVIWTWYAVILFIPLYSGLMPSYESPTHIITGLLIGIIISALFLLFVGYTLFRIQALLPLVHNPFLASVIIIFNTWLMKLLYRLINGNAQTQ